MNRVKRRSETKIYVTSTYSGFWAFPQAPPLFSQTFDLTTNIAVVLVLIGGMHAA